MILALFLASIGLVAWIYAGYPIVMALLARLRPRPLAVPPAAVDVLLPTVTVIIPARDEAERLGPKLESILAQGYPAGRLQILVVDDGSVDTTAAVLHQYAARGVSLTRMPRPVGKALALEAAVALAKGDVLVLTDARQPLLPGALAALVRPFCDGTVGAVSGELELEEGAGSLGLYRALDDRLRRWEAAVGSSVGVTGALWALRRRLWRTLPTGTILDDLHQPLGVVKQGFRVVVAPEARCRDQAAPGGRREMARRVRTLAGNLQLVRALPWTLSPVGNPIFVQLWSHKLLRLVAPAALVVAAATNLWLALFAPRHLQLFSLLLAGQILFYGLASLQLPAKAFGPVGKLASAARSFVMLHVAAALAVWQFARGRETTLWRRA